MSSLHKRFATNSAAETNGVPIKYEANDDGTVPAFSIARAHGRANPRYATAVSTHQRDHIREIELNVLDENTAREINLAIFVDGLLIGWENVQDENGAPIAFSRANAMALFRELPDLREDLEREARNFENFRKHKRDAEAKN